MSPRDNERLEYLGDAVLQLITAEYLFKLKPGAKEGEMTQLRSAMVNTNTLAALAEELGLGDYLYLGRGIAKGGGRSLRSLLANVFEAVLGAIFLDAGYDAAYHYYLDRFRSLPEPVQDENYKGRLQQVVQERYGLTPYYDSAGARGAIGRQREYTTVVYAGADPLGTGHGTTKQAAEQEAARAALSEIERRSSGRRGRQRPRAAPEPAPAPGVEAFPADVGPEAGPGPLAKAVALAASPSSVEVQRPVEVAEPAAAVPGPEPPGPEPARSEAVTQQPEARPRRRTRRPRKVEEPAAQQAPDPTPLDAEGLMPRDPDDPPGPASPAASAWPPEPDEPAVARPVPAGPAAERERDQAPG